jgi:hypothetical protein
MLSPMRLVLPVSLPTEPNGAHVRSNPPTSTGGPARVATFIDDDPSALLKKVQAALAIALNVRMPGERDQLRRRRWREVVDWLELCEWSLRQGIKSSPKQAALLFALAKTSFADADAVAFELNRSEQVEETIAGLGPRFTD